MKKGMKSCECDMCQSACKNKPGWFLPEQVKELLNYFKAQTIDEILGGKKIAIDWFEGDGDTEDILVLAPNIVNNDSIQYPNNPNGVCIFYEHGKCSIHEIKPYECAKLMHDEGVEGRHEEVAKAWSKTKMLDGFKDKIVIGSWGIMDDLMSGYSF